MNERRLALGFLTGAVLTLAACLAVALPRFDPATYTNLTHTKPVVARLYDTFAQEDVARKRIDAVRLRLDQMYEYENGKGMANGDILAQIDALRRMFERHVGERLKGEAWSAEHTANRKANILEAFDLAIRTEAAKNR